MQFSLYKTKSNRNKCQHTVIDVKLEAELPTISSSCDSSMYVKRFDLAFTLHITEMIL